MAERLQIHLDAIDNTRKAFSAFQTRLNKIKSSVFNLRSALLGIGAGAVVKGFVDAGIQIENLGVQLTALFGSAKAGKDALKVVTDFAKTTPFELSNIQQGVVALATVREVAEEAGVSFEELLKITGNTATLLGGDFALASLQIQRSFSAGIASAELFRERGITAMAGFQSGTRTSIDESIKGLRKAFGTGGIFGNLIGELSKTLFGTVSNLKDAFFTFQVAVSTGFFSELKKQLGELKSFIESNDKAIEQFGVSVGQGLSKAIISLANAGRFVTENFNIFKNILIGIISIKILAFLGQFALLIYELRKAMITLNVAMLANPLFLGASGVALIVSGIYAISNSMKDATTNAEKLAQAFKAVNEEIPMVGQDLFPNTPTAPFKQDAVFVQDDSLDLFTEIESKVGKTKSGMERILESLQKANDKDLKAFDQSWSNIYETIGVGINDSIKSMSVGIAESLVLGKKLSDVFRNMASKILISVISRLIEERILKLINLSLDKQKTTELTKQLSLMKTMSLLSRVSGISGFFGNIFGTSNMTSTGIDLNTISPFAEGGSIKAGQPALVGERGRELFIPTSNGQIIKNEDLGMGATVNFTIVANDTKDFDRLLIERRSTITNIINQALNQRGKPALV